jgi:hypothetical protein
LKSGLSPFYPLPAPYRALILLLFICTPWVAGRAQESAEPSRITIHGVVLNSVTREPVGHALVFSQDNRLATFTDDQGRFEFAFPQSAPDPSANAAEQQALGAGRLSVSLLFNSILMARKPGFLDPQKRPWTPPPNPASQELTLTLVPEALIVGRVVLPNSQAAGQIRVALYRRRVQDGRTQWFPSGDVASRSNGEFRFAELEPGTYKLFTREQMDRDPLTFDPRGPFYGYPPAYFPNATDFESAATIQLAPGMTFQAELSPVRQPYFNIKVPVTNASTDTDLMVNVAVHGRKGPGFELAYNHDDQKIEGSLPNGTYVIEATSIGPAFAQGSATLTVKGAAAEGSPLTLSPFGSVRINAQRDFKPDPESDGNQEKATQVVTNQDQWRRSTLNVRLESAEEFSQSNNFAQLRPPTGPRDDSLVLDNVAPGRYWVHIDSARGFAASVTAGDLDLLRHPLAVGPGANLTVDVSLRDDGAEISGSIEDIRGDGGENDELQPSSQVGFTRTLGGRASGYVYFIPLSDSPGQFREAPVSPEGKFNLQQLPPGAYRVLAFDQQRQDLEYRDPEAMRAYDNKGPVLRVVAGQKETLRLPLIASNE